MRRVLNCSILAAAAALVACATPAPAPAPAVASASVPATASASKSTIPFGYKRVVMDNGEVRFCRNDLVTGSRTEHQKVCLTEAQLKASQDNSQDFINSVQGHGGMSTTNTTPGGGGAMGR